MPLASEETEEILGSPQATFRFLLERIMRGPSKFPILPRQDRLADEETRRRMEGAHPVTPKKEDKLVPYVTEGFAKNAEGIVVEHRGSNAVQDYNAELARRTWLYSQAIAKATQCWIKHEAGARAVTDMVDPRSGRLLKAGEDVPERKVAPHDKYGKPLNQAFGHSFPDMAFLAVPTQRRLFINSYTPNSQGHPNAWEHFSSLRLHRNAATGDIVLLVPKLRPGEVLDAAKFEAIVFPLLMEICYEFKQGDGERVPIHIAPHVKQRQP